MNENPTPASLDDYEVLKQIGKGSYGTVFKVRRRSDDLMYAMKTIMIDQMDKKALTNTLNELRILCSVNHPNVVGYKEAFVQRDGRELCVIMEFVGGGDLSERIAECKKKRTFMDEETIWRYACQVLLGLKALHEMKIIHRDIKSANLFLTEDLSSVKLGDLNVAKVAKNDLASTQIGTPFYLAPEIWQNKLYDYKCDVFSLGCVLYEVASLKMPFEAGSLQELYKKLMRGVIERIPPRYSDDLYSFIKLLLARDPRSRPDVREITAMPVFKSRMQAYCGLDLVRQKHDMDKLMETIVVPRNLKQLGGNLPRKIEKTQSCKLLGNSNLSFDKQQIPTNMAFVDFKSFKQDDLKQKTSPGETPVEIIVGGLNSNQKTHKLCVIKFVNRIPPVRPPINPRTAHPQYKIGLKDSPLSTRNDKELNQLKDRSSKLISEGNNGALESLDDITNSPPGGKFRQRVASADPLARQSGLSSHRYRLSLWD